MADVAAGAVSIKFGDDGVQRASWHGVLAVEGVETGDGREFAKGSLTWPDSPVRLQWQKETTHGGINDLVVEVGTVEKITRKGNEIRGEGYIDLASEDGAEYARRLRDNGPGGVSIVADDPEHADVEYRFPEGCDDLLGGEDTPIDDVPIEDLIRCMEPEVVVFHSGRIRAVTGVDTPAFVEAMIELDEEEAVAASADTPPATVTLTVNGHTVDLGEITDFSKLGETLSHALTEALPTSASNGKITLVSEAPWDGSASRFTDAEYKRACAICEGDGTVKQTCHLPHHEPGGEVSRAGVHAAAGGRGVSRLQGVSADGIASAKSHLRTHYTRDLDEEPPDSLTEAEEPEETAVEETLETAVERPEDTAVEIPESLVAAAYTVTIPDVPPMDWYAEPADLPAIGAISVTPEGRIYGLLAPAGVAHRAFPDQRVEVPRGNVDYTRFMNRPTPVTLADGSVEEIPAGVVTMNCGHAKPLASVPAQAALDHYDNSCSIVATVRVGENKHGVWVAGALMPGIEHEDLARLLACQLSGDWRPHREQAGMRELAGALLVPVPGFATAGPTVRLDHGELVAAAAPVTFTSVDGEYAIPAFKIGQTEDGQGCDPETDPDCMPMAGQTVDTGVVEDLPDFASVMAARDPRRLAAQMAAELGLDPKTRLAALVASVRGDDT